MAPNRRGLALVSVFWWIATASTVLTLTFIWTMQKARSGAKIQKITEELYLAEGVLAGEINRLKSRPWSRRWYVPEGATGAGPGGLHGQPIQGRFESAAYSGWVQDVADPWPAPGAVPGAVLEDHTDIFLKVKYGAAEDPAQGRVRSFFYRVVFRRPNAERPTAALCRRFAEAEADCDFDLPDGRALQVRRIAKDEVQRERGRAESSVHERELRQLDRDTLAPDVLWSRLLDVPGLDRQVETERRILGLLREGQRLLTDRLALGTPNRYGQARERFAEALRLSRGTDRANLEFSVPRCLFAAGRGEWLYARTLSRDGIEGAERRATLQRARDLFDELVRTYPFQGREFPGRTESPHALVAKAFTIVNEADPDDPADYNAAVDRAILVLESLRFTYPEFHLWDEDAITGTVHPGPSTPEDETVWYLEQMVHLPVLSFGGFVVEVSPTSGWRPAQSILRWTPSPPPVGNWLVVGKLRIPFGGIVDRVKATQLAPRRGECLGDRYLILGSGYLDGASGIYDVVTNDFRSGLGKRRILGVGHQDVLLPDGRVLIIGGDGANAGWAEIFDPATETFALAPRRSAPFPFPPWLVSRLADGRVLLVGGASTLPDTAAEVFDSSNGSFSPVANRMHDLRREAQALSLDDGSVLILGNSPDYKMTAQLFLPNNNLFWPGLSPPSTPAAIAPWPATPIGEVVDSNRRGYPWAVKLRDGRVLLGGGDSPSSRPNFELRSAEIFDPATRSFASAGSTMGLGSYRSAAVLPSGRVVVTGCGNSYVDDGGGVDIFDPRSSTWTTGAPTPMPLSRHMLVRLLRKP